MNDTLGIERSSMSLRSTTHLVGLFRCSDDFLGIFRPLVLYLRQNEPLLGHFAHNFTLTFRNAIPSAPMRRKYPQLGFWRVNCT